MTNTEISSFTKTIKEVDEFKKYNIDTKSKVFKRYYNASLLNEVDEVYISEVRKFWKENYFREIDPVLHLAFKNLTGKKDTRIIPGEVMWKDIIPYFNDMGIRAGYSDKNIYDKLLNPPHSAETVLKRVRGTYFDSKNNALNANEAYQLLIDFHDEMIIKPSNTDNGKGIAKLTKKEQHIYLHQKVVTMTELEDIYGSNFIVQKVIKQHPVMAEPHPSSVNTLRMVTFRWKNEIRYLLTFARFGANNDVKDNAGTGGVCCGITDSGEFMDYAVDEHVNKYTHHPTTNYRFASGAKVPNFETFKQYVIDLHKDILHHDFVSWDIAVGEDGMPVFIEMNFRGATWLYQLAAQRSIFGDLTEEVLQYVSEQLQDDKLKRKTNMYNPEKKLQKTLKTKIKLEKQNVQYKKENDKLKAQIKELKGKVKKNDKELKRIENSKIWKVTGPLRKLRRILKKNS